MRPLARLRFGAPVVHRIVVQSPVGAGIVMPQFFGKPARAFSLRAILSNDDVFARLRFDIGCGHAGHGNLALVHINPPLARLLLELFNLIHNRRASFARPRRHSARYLVNLSAKNSMYSSYRSRPSGVSWLTSKCPAEA
ncbi:hypothetical protein SDC9_91073 [bioreactor metagenome]|uniref:Uncharacterized protein n=1 Tax=bioreactor metagenome TaxID=1076179 RepID=A0A644ZU42_9ZZZZ